MDETRSLIAESWPATCRIGRTLAGTRAIIAAALVASALLGAGCASMPPGMDGPKPASTALADPGKTTLGKRFAARENAHQGLSGFRLLIDGTDTFALHLEIADKAERTLDVQYFLLRAGRHRQAVARIAAAGCRPRRSRADVARRRGGVRGRFQDSPAGSAPEYRDPHFQSVHRAARADASSLGRVRRRKPAPQLPDAQQAVHRRQRHRRHRWAQRRRRVLPGEHQGRVRRLRPGGRRADGASAVAELRSLLERSSRDSGRDGCCSAKPTQEELDKTRQVARRRTAKKWPTANTFGRFRRPTFWIRCCPASVPLVWARRRSPTTSRTRPRRQRKRRGDSCGSALPQRSKKRSASSLSSRPTSFPANPRWR